MSVPRPEYPRPQFERGDWMNLNGAWTYEFDFSGSGKERGLEKTAGFGAKITVPFCPESKLSGVGFTDFIPEMWYHRKVTVPAAWAGKKILFHCGGIDYFMELYVDGVFAGTHTGGSSPVDLEIEKFVKPGRKHDFVIRVKDDPRSGYQALGKQSAKYASWACLYTRVTGIWQTVWLEAVDPCGLKRCTVTPDFDAGAFAFAPEFHAAPHGGKLRIRVLDGKKVAAETLVAAADTARPVLALASPKAWSPASPFLYGIEYTVLDAAGNTVDRVKSYAGLRKFHVEGDRLYLNNEEIFLRFVLDQGFYPDGVWTAPSDEALKHDIELALQAGFNGARLHQKVFEERFHYWADRLGYLTWAEFSDWGMSFWRTRDPRTAYHALRDFYAQWTSVVKRDVNHPSILAWTPFNESHEYLDLAEHRRIVSDIYDLTKTLDPTRPVNDTSGYVHVKTDLWTAHNYARDAKTLREHMETLPVWMNRPDDEKGFYNGQPYLLDEYGGVGWIPKWSKPYSSVSWGYGGMPETEQAALKRISSLTKLLLELPHMRGYCYTQLTDVEQEQNGIYTYDRRPKFDMEKIRAIFSAGPKRRKKTPRR